MNHLYLLQVFLYICFAELFVSCLWVAFFSNWRGKPATLPSPPSCGNPEEFRKRADAMLGALHQVGQFTKENED